MKHPFSSVTVFVEWRCTGEGVPDDRCVRARVIETQTPAGGICRAFGEELVAPRRITDRQMSQVHCLCIAKLRGLAPRIIFRYEPLMRLEPEEYPVHGEVA